MKFVIAFALFLLIDFVAVFPLTANQNWGDWLQNYRNSQQKRSQPNCRLPLFNCRLINKIRPSKSQSPLQDFPSEFGAYGQSSSAFPSYAVPAPYSGSPYSGSVRIPGHLLPDYAEYPSASNQNPMAAQLSVGQTEFIPSSTYSAQNYGQSPNTIDVHKVLDQFIRSAGLSPQGDHEAQASHASSFAKWGTTPVVVFKKLFSFPFYLSSNPEVVDIYGKGWK